MLHRGASSEEECEECPPGYYCAEEGLSAPTGPCPPGKKTRLNCGVAIKPETMRFAHSYHPLKRQLLLAKAVTTRQSRLFFTFTD